MDRRIKGLGLVAAVGLGLILALCAVVATVLSDDPPPGVAGGCGISAAAAVSPAAVSAAQPAVTMQGLRSGVSAFLGADAAADTPGSGSFDPGSFIVPAHPGGTFGGVSVTADQEKMAATEVAVAKAMGLTPRAARIGLAVSMQESRFNPDAVNQQFVGLFQQSPAGDGIYTQYARTDPAGSSWMFFHQLVARVPGYDTDSRQDYEIGEVVQESGVGGNVLQWQPMAAALEPALWSEAQTAPASSAVQTSGAPGATGAPAPGPVCTGGGAHAAFDAANITSDAVFYNTATMTVPQISAFISAQDSTCAAGNPWCLKNLTLSYPPTPASRNCQPMPAGDNTPAAQAIWDASQACGINPQVMLTKLQLESQGLSRPDATQASYAAAWGWNCPDTGPGGSANCAPAAAGFINQLHGMANTWANLKVDVPAGKYPYQVGPSSVLWNVAESGCGGATIDIKNVATASLYVYTPYQPNAASIAAYPGEGDQCSSYGNRNYFFMFQRYFGDTGGGTTATTTGTPSGGSGGGGAPGAGSVVVNGVSVTIPDKPDVPAQIRGKSVTAPTAAMAKGLAAGFATIGLPYVYGGGTNGDGPDQGCARAGGQLNSCQGIVGFDCSGLTGYVLQQAGFQIPDNSGGQRGAGTSVPISAGQSGDIIGYSGHVAIYLLVDGVQYELEAPDVGLNVHIRAAYWSNEGVPADTVLHRYWS